MQFTNWGNCSSEIVKNHPYSIIQGSKNGPKLFNLYVNEISKITSLVSVLYADDSTFLYSCKSPDLLCKVINEELDTIRDYFNSNGLSISISKTTYMIFTPNNKSKISLNIKLGSEVLKENDEITLLGCIIDNKLRFSSHFHKVYSKMKKGLNGLIMVKNQLTYRAKLNVYHGLIHSHLSYCSLIWISSISKKELRMLSILQKKALRIIFSAKYNAHTDPLFERSRITKVENTFEKESLLMTYKFQNNCLPTSIQKLFENSLYDKDRITRYLSSCVLRPKRELKNGLLMYDIIDHWNRIGESSRNEKTFRGFKRNVTAKLNNFIPCNKLDCYSCK